MAIEFLTVEQRRSHGCFNGEPTADHLARYFHLDDFDRPIIEEHRGGSQPFRICGAIMHGAISRHFS